ncbi:MAG: ribosome rescue GTPase HflX [Gammaproteobacteria bacterium]
MFDRPKQGERAILVHIEHRRSALQKHSHTSYDLEEFRELAKASQVEVQEVLSVPIRDPHARCFIGMGKVEELKSLVTQHKAEVVLFNCELSPGQERNLEKELECRVLNRTGLILDIFAQRARSFEGKLQVELAQLRHLSTRLVRGWTHLERQKGGIGLRGPGETQLELDRRLIKNRIQYLELRLEKLQAQRENGRRARKKALLPTIALVGYTNAGKSTLFNALSQAQVFVADQLFATLDPTFRQMAIPQIGKIILIDTVGFVSNLPHDLIDAFSTTLQEAQEADLLLHVINLGQETWRYQMTQVEEVLAQLEILDLPRIEVYNKIDCIPGQAAHIEKNAENKTHRVWISAATGLGLDLLLDSIQERLGSDILVQVFLELPMEEAALRAKLYSWQAVLSEEILENGNIRIQASLPKTKWLQLCHNNPAMSNYQRSV